MTNFKTRECDLILQRDKEIVSLFKKKRRELFQLNFEELVALKKRGIEDDEYIIIINKFYSLNDDAIIEVSKSKASRFWLSPEQASKIISIYERHITDKASPKIIERNKLLYSLYKTHSDRLSKSISELAVEIVENPSPSFFIEISRIKAIISQHEKHK